MASLSRLSTLECTSREYLYASSFSSSVRSWMASIFSLSSESCRSAVCSFSCLSANLFWIAASSFSSFSFSADKVCASPFRASISFLSADNWASFSACSFFKFSTIEVKPLTLRSAIRMSEWREERTCWWRLIFSSIVEHSSDSIRRYSSVLRCFFPVSETLEPLDMPHLLLTSA